MDIYYKQSDIAASLSELMLSPWALDGAGIREAGIQEALHLVQDMINGEVPDSMKIPGADVVEVVRCKDCRSCMEFTPEYKKDGHYGTCRMLLFPMFDPNDARVKAADFCSRGERKEDKP